MTDVPRVSTHLRSELDDGLLQIVLARPDKLNALLGETLDGIATLVRWAAVIRRAAASCCGRRARRSAWATTCGAWARDGGGVGRGRVHRLVCPTSWPRSPGCANRSSWRCTARCTAGRWRSAACNLRVGDRTTVYDRVRRAHVRVGTSLLPMFVGVPSARRLLLLAEPVEAEQALQLGLLDELTEPGKALAAATELARRLAQGPTRAYG